jgi:hypothetical protein
MNSLMAELLEGQGPLEMDEIFGYWTKKFRIRF